MAGTRKDTHGSPEVEQWIEAVRRGDNHALGRLLESCRAYLLLIANQELEPDLRPKIGASDMVQESFLEAQRDFSHFQGDTEAELLSWLRRILLNNLANLNRDYRGTGKRDLAREVSQGELGSEPFNKVIEEAESVSSQLAAREQDATLWKAIEQLHEPSRRVIQWRSYDRCSFEDIAGRLGISAEAARKIWARAVDQLRSTLSPNDERERR